MISTATYDVAGLREPAEIVVDRHGIPHVRAGSRRDLFFVQGLNAARDRLWQIDLWRKRGLGLALLRQAFAEFYRHGWTQVGLDVDSESETGATRLYERAGMRVAPGHAYAVYRKELRPGTEFVPPDADA